MALSRSDLNLWFNFSSSESTDESKTTTTASESEMEHSTTSTGSLSNTTSQSTSSPIAGNSRRMIMEPHFSTIRTPRGEKRKIVMKDSKLMAKRIKTMVNSFEACYNEIVEELNQRVTDSEEFNRAVTQVERRETALKKFQQEFEERFKERLLNGESAIKKLAATEKELNLARSEIEKYKIQVSLLNDRIEELEKGQNDDKLQEAIENQ